MVRTWGAWEPVDRSICDRTIERSLLLKRLARLLEKGNPSLLREARLIREKLDSQPNKMRLQVLKWSFLRMLVLNGAGQEQKEECQSEANF